MIAPPEAILQTSTGGRAFLLEAKDDARHVITATHCLPFIPPAHPARSLSESTFKDFLGPLDGKADVWTECLFADVMSDLAVLGTPDTQDLYEQAAAFDALIENRPALRMSTQQFKPRKDHPGFIFSLEGVWEIARVTASYPLDPKKRLRSWEGWWGSSIRACPPVPKNRQLRRSRESSSKKN